MSSLSSSTYRSSADVPPRRQAHPTTSSSLLDSTGHIFVQDARNGANTFHLRVGLRPVEAEGGQDDRRQTAVTCRALRHTIEHTLFPRAHPTQTCPRLRLNGRELSAAEDDLFLPTGAVVVVEVEEVVAPDNNTNTKMNQSLSFEVLPAAHGERKHDDPLTSPRGSSGTTISASSVREHSSATTGASCDSNVELQANFLNRSWGEDGRQDVFGRTRAVPTPNASRTLDVTHDLPSLCQTAPSQNGRRTNTPAATATNTIMSDSLHYQSEYQRAFANQTHQSSRTGDGSTLHHSHNDESINAALRARRKEVDYGVSADSDASETCHPPYPGHSADLRPTRGPGATNSEDDRPQGWGGSSTSAATLSTMTTSRATAVGVQSSSCGGGPHAAAARRGHEPDYSPEHEPFDDWCSSQALAAMEEDGPRQQVRHLQDECEELERALEMQQQLLVVERETIEDHSALERRNISVRYGNHATKLQARVKSLTAELRELHHRGEHVSRVSQATETRAAEQERLTIPLAQAALQRAMDAMCAVWASTPPPAVASALHSEVPNGEEVARRVASACAAMHVQKARLAAASIKGLRQEAELKELLVQERRTRLHREHHKEKMHVVVRIRPPTLPQWVSVDVHASEWHPFVAALLSSRHDYGFYAGRENKAIRIVDPKRGERTMAFPYVFPQPISPAATEADEGGGRLREEAESSQQRQIFEQHLRPLLERICQQRFHATVLSVGAPGSGKSYSTFGPHLLDGEESHVALEMQPPPGASSATPHQDPGHTGLTGLSCEAVGQLHADLRPHFPGSVASPRLWWRRPPPRAAPCAEVDGSSTNVEGTSGLRPLDGLLPRAVAWLLSRRFGTEGEGLPDEPPQPIVSSITCAAYELYNDRVFDLLASAPKKSTASSKAAAKTQSPRWDRTQPERKPNTPAPAGSGGGTAPELSIVPTRRRGNLPYQEGGASTGGWTVDATEIPVSDIGHIRQQLQRINHRRHCVETARHPHSHRGHMFIRLRWQVGNSEEPVELLFCDLAGAERLSLSARDAQPVTVEEAQRSALETQHINRSLSALREVLGALGESMVRPAASSSKTAGTSKGKAATFTEEMGQIVRLVEPLAENPLRVWDATCHAQPSRSQVSISRATASVFFGIGTRRPKPAHAPLFAHSSTLAILAPTVAPMTTEGTTAAGGEAFIPFRSSKLTQLLQHTISGRSRALVVACLAPCCVSEVSFPRQLINVDKPSQLGMAKLVRTATLLFDEQAPQLLSEGLATLDLASRAIVA